MHIIVKKEEEVVHVPTGLLSKREKKKAEYQTLMLARIFS